MPLTFPRTSPGAAGPRFRTDRFRTGWFRTGWFRADAAMALLGVVLVAEVGSLFFRTPDVGPVVLVADVLLRVVVLAVAGLRHRWPVAVAVAALAVTGVYFPLSVIDGTTPLFTFVVALYTLARAGRLAAAVTLAALAMLALGYGELIAEGGERHVENATVLMLSGWVVSLIALGHATRVRGAYQAEVEQRMLAAERERDVRARQSATEERLRIARELHDVLGHNISLINVQSTAALHRSAKRPGQTAELTGALESVRDASKEALRELRTTLGVLRQVDEEAPTAPAPAGLDRVAELAERASVAGLRVTVATEGEPPVVPAQISLAAYRIVQESLTNVTRHAGASRAEVHLSYAPGELRLRVDDDGAGAPDAGALGSGIAGMAARARALGGDLTAANAADGTGFRVAARLPLPAGPA
ncbi:sensor histidine kinase [Streptomyces hainanensis]|uniref:histidine kinase n=1 Tax=Streptomyces hainanensis TaxID=402648 RepID=A0A4R4TGD2_9ACTN|nr:sensor histidine kinase [Streptomyces hainanensis]TDC76681.1 sensor histidine kinase [Streptomyces hainanensis]